MPITLDGTNGITTPTYGGADTSEYLVPVTSMKNRIINGAMVIDQRNAGASVTPANQQYLVDRWLAGLTQSSKFTAQQSSVAPDGFSNSLLITSSSAYSVGSGDAFFIQQRIEGFNSADLMYGTATAKTTTLSFWVRSSLTGTFGGNYTNSGTTRSYPFSYTISSANTWEYKTVTISGDTTGTWVGATNGQGLLVTFSLGTGSTLSNTAGAWAAGNFLSATGATSVVGTNGATFYITGVQLEVGSTATSFDYRPYTTELQLCQRYTYRHSAEGNVDNYAPLGQGRYYGTNTAQLYVPFKVTMRTSPSSVTQVGNIVVNDTALSPYAITLALNETSSSGATVTGTTTSGTTAGNATTFYADNTSNAALIFSAEL